MLFLVFATAFLNATNNKPAAHSQNYRSNSVSGSQLLFGSRSQHDVTTALKLPLSPATIDQLPFAPPPPKYACLGVCDCAWLLFLSTTPDVLPLVSLTTAVVVPYEFASEIMLDKSLEINILVDTL